jgi:hypothetical protein
MKVHGLHIIFYTIKSSQLQNILDGALENLWPWSFPESVRGSPKNLSYTQDVEIIKKLVKL